MMPAKYFLNLVQSRNAFRRRLSIPEHDKTLSAHTAAGFSVSMCLLAKNLHCDLVCARGDPKHEGDNIAIFIGLNIPPSWQEMRTFGEEPAPHFGGGHVHGGSDIAYPSVATCRCLRWA